VCLLSNREPIAATSATITGPRAAMSAGRATVTAGTLVRQPTPKPMRCAASVHT
jgi:hypothetical protein